ncbi:RING-box protein 1a-like isoform X3 [Amaranthus tricolor]|uniref:RING-box protein 1a-like isoform X3 n=1 Tax=Amaranthus tricolor TaxID=29722 RepID=UPI002585ACC6|nr:RING-box protein 1a-like isoform X3 [Amaranthus tricolor]
MVPAGEGSSVAGPSSKIPKRFEIKKWNAVALWAWDIVVDNCAICRNHIMDLCKVLNVKLIKLVLQVKIALLLGVFAIMPSISIASAVGC